MKTKNAIREMIRRNSVLSGRHEKVIKILEDVEVDRERLGYELFKYDRAKERLSEFNGESNPDLYKFLDEQIENAMRRYLRK